MHVCSLYIMVFGVHKDYIEMPVSSWEDTKKTVTIFREEYYTNYQYFYRSLEASHLLFNNQLTLLGGHIVRSDSDVACPWEIIWRGTDMVKQKTKVPQSYHGSIQLVSCRSWVSTLVPVLWLVHSFQSWKLPINLGNKWNQIVCK